MKYLQVVPTTTGGQRPPTPQPGRAAAPLMAAYSI